MPKKEKAKKSTKKKVTKPVELTLLAPDVNAAAHTKCFTNPSLGERWVSKLGAAKNPDGAFTIGDGTPFQGHHSSKGNVNGDCLGNGMQIRTSNGAFFYTGNYVPNGPAPTHIEGTCFSLVNATLTDDGNLLLTGDPWEADKET